MSVAGYLVASAVTKGIGAIGGRRADKKALAEQERLDLENIRLDKLETEESIRRTEESQRETVGTQRNQVGASGFAAGSSLDKYISTTQAKQSSDVDWMRTSGASRNAISAREASARRSAGEDQSKAKFVSGIGDTIGTVGAAGAAKNKFGWGWSEKT